MLYLVLESDQAITGCPIGMMDAAARCLERNDTALAARFVPGIADDTGHHLTVAMFLTEKAGGSDVGANETRRNARRTTAPGVSPARSGSPAARTAT